MLNYTLTNNETRSFKMANFYSVTTKSGLECFVKSQRDLMPSAIKDAAYLMLLDRVEEYDAGDKFSVIMECDEPKQFGAMITEVV